VFLLILYEKNRPVSLALSPSEANLAERNLVPIVLEEGDDRAVLSDVRGLFSCRLTFACSRIE
jgi:hypothetical protein